MVDVHLDNVTVSYARHPAVHHVNGCFASGTLTAVAGPNGAGKSTLLKAIAGILPLDEGHVRLQGVGEGRVAYLPQVAELQRDFPMSVLHLAATGVWHACGGLGAITPAMKERAAEALMMVGLRGFEKRDLASLSSGQFQRALFARLLVQDAGLILLDEPFNAVDADTTSQLIELMLRWHKEKRTVICVLHDIAQIRQYFPRCLLLARECIAWDATPQVLNPERLFQARFFREGWSLDNQLCERAV